jgi:hypothetical protein
MTARRRLLTRNDLVNPALKLPVAPATRNNSVLGFAQADIWANPQINMAHPGRMKTIIEALPADDAARLIAGATHYDHQVQLGRHGDPDYAAREMEVDPDVARRIHEGMEVDTVCTALQNRRSDADLPIEPPTRRDVIGAALDSFDSEE